MAVQRARPAGDGRHPASLARRDADLFERLYDEHSAMVYRTAFRVLANPVHAQDVVQDVFARLWRHPERFDATRGSVASYLKVMAHTRALDVWREAQVARRARERLKVLALCDEGRADDRPPLAAELRGDRRVVLSQLRRLPDVQRQALVLAYWGGLTAEEIAEHCGLPVGTVKSRLRLGLMKMRQRCERQLALAA
jgi:RNA polymerase sigma-70 factor (ECF subfamily)